MSFGLCETAPHKGQQYCGITLAVAPLPVFAIDRAPVGVDNIGPFVWTIRATKETPMRITVNDVDPVTGKVGQNAMAKYGIDVCHVRVTLDGVIQHHAITADTDAGLIERYVTEDDGRGGRKLTVGPDDHAVTQTRYGKVTIEPYARWDDTWPHPGVTRPAKPEEPEPPPDITAHLRF
jgi:hypothetical protein